MPMNNPFDNPSFNLIEMTRSINIIPNNYGWVRSQNIFSERGVHTTSVAIEEMNGVLNVLRAKPRGSDPDVNTSGKRKLRRIETLHYPIEDQIHPEDIQDVRRFDSQNEYEDADSVMLAKLEEMRGKHGITKEYALLGALKGAVLNDDGSVLVDMYDEFGVTKKKINMQLTTAATEVRSKTIAIRRHMEDNLMGENMTGIDVLASRDFFDSFIEHANVKEVFKATEASVERLGGDIRQEGFKFGAIRLVEYGGTISAPDGRTIKLVEDGKAHAFPRGTLNTFEVNYAPGNFLSTVNTVGLELYARADRDPKDRWLDIYTESNPLPLCKRPALLVELSAS
ncbi:MAG: major capsid protein [Pseudomonadota bacterium]